MPRTFSSLTRLASVAAACAAAAGCGSFDSVSHRLAGAITPYKVEVVQGNFVSSEQVAALKPGMSRQQVREVLGTPLVSSLFHADRWDYVFTLKRQGVEPQSKRLTVFFKGDALERFDGDAMPTEAEFVAAIGTRRAGAKVPELEASEEALRRYERPAPDTPPAAAPGAAKTYPPLEPAAR